MTPEERGETLLASWWATAEGPPLANLIAEAIREAIEADRAARQCPDVDVQAIRERCERATPGPWHHARDSRWGYVTTEADGAGTPLVEILDVEPNTGTVLHSQVLANADFIAHAREDIPALFSLVDFYAGLLADLKKDSDAYHRGLADGRREERARAVRWARFHEARMRRDEIASRALASEHGTLVCRGGASTAGQIAESIAQEGDPS